MILNGAHLLANHVGELFITDVHMHRVPALVALESEQKGATGVLFK